MRRRTTFKDLIRSVLIPYYPGNIDCYKYFLNMKAVFQAMTVEF